MKKLFFIFLTLSITISIFSYTVYFEIENLEKLEDDIFLAGSFNSWKYGDPNFKFEFKNGKYILKTDLSGVIKFTVNRGSKEKSEIKSVRIARIFKDNIKIKLFVKGFSDMKGKLIKYENFYSPQLKNFRDIIVYIPPKYEENLPVIYMHDGQNLFDKKTSFIGIEWKIDETLDELINNGEIEPIIVVGIYNTKDRLSEYSPWYDEKFKAGGKGDSYIKFIVETLKPFIDNNFKANKEKTFIGGSSMGGLISLYALAKYPEIFSGAIAMSPSLFFANEKIFEYIKDNPPKGKIYMDVGKLEDKEMVILANKMKEILNDFSVKIYFRIYKNGKHNEYFWGKRFKDAIKKILND